MTTERAGASDPLVSVIVPTYGRDQPSLGDALESVFDQTYANVEVVVVDDAPEPVGLVDDPPIPVQRVREGHDGVAAARNTGIECSNGEFLAFLDDDDRWLPRKLDRQLAAVREGGQDVGVVVTGQRYVNEDGDTVGTVEPRVSGDVTGDLFRGRINCAFSTLLVRADAARETGSLDERFEAWEDLEWCLRLSEGWEFRSVPQPLVLRRDGAHEQLTDDFEEMRDRAYPLFLDKHRARAAEYGPSAERGLVASLSRVLGSEGLDNGYYRDASRFFVRSIRHDPGSLAPYLYLLLSLGGRYTYRPARCLKRRLAGDSDASRTVPE